MHQSRWVQRVSAAALSISFFLPLAQCSLVKPGQPPEVVVRDIFAFNAYPWPSVGSTVALALFFWPLLLQLCLLKRSEIGVSIFQAITEMLLSLFTAIGIAWLVFLSTSIRYGAFVAWGSTLVYFIAAARSLLAARHTNRRHAT